MTSFFIKTFLVLSLISCADRNKSTADSVDKTIDKTSETSKEEPLQSNNEGYLFVEISKIYNSEGEFTVMKDNGNPMFYFKGKNIFIADNEYDIINDEHAYKKLINVEAYFPENDLFILKANKTENSSYEVTINDGKGKVDGEKYSAIIKFKTQQEYVLEGYPNPTKDNPLRVSPNDSSDIVSGYEDHTYISVEIEGDWLKVKDDKECYSGEEPSKDDIIGWIRWKKDGKVIIDIRHIC